MSEFYVAGENETHANTKQFATFMVADRWYGIDVMCVQEVTKPMQVTLMRTAPPFVRGLINLRGQIATAIGLRELFALPLEDSNEKMTVVCKVEDVLLSLQVDNIGDVVEVNDSKFEKSPQTIPANIKEFMLGVYKTEHAILSIISLDTILHQLDKRCA